MARVDPGDDGITRFIVRHYRYDPERRERRMWWWPRSQRAGILGRPPGRAGGNKPPPGQRRAGRSGRARARNRVRARLSAPGGERAPGHPGHQARGGRAGGSWRWSRPRTQHSSAPGARRQAAIAAAGLKVRAGRRRSGSGGRRRACRARGPGVRRCGGRAAQLLVAAERDDRADAHSADESGERGGQDVLPAAVTHADGASAATRSLARRRRPANVKAQNGRHEFQPE